MKTQCAGSCAIMVILRCWPVTVHHRAVSFEQPGPIDLFTEMLFLMIDIDVPDAATRRVFALRRTVMVLMPFAGPPAAPGSTRPGRRTNRVTHW
jgi:hypothetical protein